MATTVRNVVLVHGAFADGSGWQGVHEALTADGYTVSIVQNPTLSLEDDVAATRRILDRQDGPAVLVGHSYGGAVISQSGTHPGVAALVYVAAFAPDKGESVNTLIADPAPGAPPAPATTTSAPCTDLPDLPTALSGSLVVPLDREDPAPAGSRREDVGPGTTRPSARSVR